MFVMTVDQRGSRADSDRVEDLLARVAGTPVVRAFERTAGDEVQAVIADADPVVDLAMLLADDGHWSIGIGVGAVELPLPASTRAGRGPAFEFARDAVEAAKNSHPPIAVRGEPDEQARYAQTALRLLIGITTTRSDAGREAVRLIHAGMSQVGAAERLGISQQAMSQRLRAARWDSEQPARELAVELLRQADSAAAR